MLLVLFDALSEALHRAHVVVQKCFFCVSDIFAGRAVANTAQVVMEAERHDRIRQVLRVTKGFEAVKSDRARRPLDLEIPRPEEHTSELQSLMRNSYAVFCLKKTNNTHNYTPTTTSLRRCI